MRTDKINVIYILNLLKDINRNNKSEMEKSVDLILREIERSDNEKMRYKKDIMNIAKLAQGKSIVHISADSLKKLEIVYPTSSVEQQKIIAFFSAYDEKIAFQKERVEALEERKKGLLQKIFSQEIRFEANGGGHYQNWEEKTLADVFRISTETNGNRYGKQDVMSVSDEYGVVNQIKLQGRSFAGDDISKYKAIKTGQIIYTRSPLAAKPFGIIKRVDKESGIVSPLYIVNDVRENNCSLFWYYYFDMPERTNIICSHIVFSALFTPFIIKL